MALIRFDLEYMDILLSREESKILSAPPAGHFCVVKTNKTLFRIRDAKDYPVLYTAIIEDLDILITGDKDFAEVEIEKPDLMTPADFMAKYL